MSIRTIAGDCLVRFDGQRERTVRGRVLIIIKPDDTILVHDVEGYQPVAWLTRPDTLTVEADGDGVGITARAGDQILRVTCERDCIRRSFRASTAGVPVGECPACDGTLVRSGGDVICPDCTARYGLPAGATVLSETCPDCGLPTMRVERGETFEICIDYACESLADVVSQSLDRSIDCPDCGQALRVRSPDGRIFLGCDGYPDCETTFSFPAGRIVGECPCGLPVFETATGRRCLDGTCERS